VGLVEQVQEGGIGGPTLEVQAERLVQRLSVPLGKGLQISVSGAIEN
jgi:dihydroorotate dehydrogenase